LNDQQHKDEIQEEAALWFARLRGGDLGKDVEPVFMAWLKASDEHERAFSRLCTAWDVLGDVPKSRRPRRHILARREVIGGAVAAGIAGYFLLRPQAAEAKIYRTAIGEQKHFTLPDGSSLFLDTASDLSVLCDGHTRKVTLACGRAHLEVKAQNDDALLMAAGGAQVVSRRGVFDIGLADGRVIVFLQQNDALVKTPGRGEFRLQAGDRIILPASGEAAIDRPGRDAVTAWQRGILIFDQTALGDAVREMNRYSRLKLTVSDAKAAQMKISGAYGAGKAAEFLHTLTLLLPVRVDTRGDTVEISSSL